MGKNIRSSNKTKDSLIDGNKNKFLNNDVHCQ